MVVIGIKRGEFVDDSTGKKIHYAKLYVTYPFGPNGKLPEGCIGEKCEVINVPLRLLDKVKLGDRIEVLYNKYGRIRDIVVKKDE
jgi:hypothetical protein